MVKNKKNSPVDINAISDELSEYLEKQGHFGSKDAFKSLIILLDNLFYNMTSEDALMLSFIGAKNDIGKIDMDVKKAVDFLSKVYRAANNRRQQNIFSRL